MTWRGPRGSFIPSFGAGHSVNWASNQLYNGFDKPAFVDSAEGGAEWNQSRISEIQPQSCVIVNLPSTSYTACNSGMCHNRCNDITDPAKTVWDSSKLHTVNYSRQDVTDSADLFTVPPYASSVVRVRSLNLHLTVVSRKWTIRSRTATGRVHHLPLWALVLPLWSQQVKIKAFIVSL